MAKVSYCTFFLGEMYLGVEVSAVQEVIRDQEPTRVPRAPPTVRGLISLRGHIITLIDLRVRLGLDPSPAGQASMSVVLRSDDLVCGLSVDHVGGVVVLSDQSIEPYPGLGLKESVRHLILGVYPMNERLLLVLDSARLTASPLVPRRGEVDSCA